MRVLVVDDSNTMRRIVINALKTLGYADVVEAGDGKEALAKCDGTIGLVITDWNMPVMSGLDFVKVVRSTPAIAALPILMVTTRGTQDDVLAAVQAGVNNYILKPFTPAALKEKIDAVLSARAA